MMQDLSRVISYNTVFHVIVYVQLTFSFLNHPYQFVNRHFCQYHYMMSQVVVVVIIMAVLSLFLLQLCFVSLSSDTISYDKTPQLSSKRYTSVELHFQFFFYGLKYKPQTHCTKHFTVSLVAGPLSLTFILALFFSSKVCHFMQNRESCFDILIPCDSQIPNCIGMTTLQLFFTLYCLVGQCFKYT